MLTRASIHPWDERRNLIIPGNTEAAIQFAVEHWLHTAERSIQQRGRFAVALSGGSTPKAIYESLAQIKNFPWDQVFLFWSDERAVPPDHPDSNYRMAMESGFQNIPIPKGQIFRMEAEKNLGASAFEYEDKIRQVLGKHFFDLVMLGVGDDGHTASLFPGTDALQVTDRLVCPVYISSKKVWRMTLTFPCIEQSYGSAIYALGNSKKEIVPKVLNAPILSPWPASRLGTAQSKALWILDLESGANLPPVDPAPL